MKRHSIEDLVIKIENCAGFHRATRILLLRFQTILPGGIKERCIKTPLGGYSMPLGMDDSREQSFVALSIERDDWESNRGFRMWTFCSLWRQVAGLIRSQV